MATRDDEFDIEAGFAEIARALFAPDSTTATLQRIVDVAASTIDGCDLAGILVIEDGEVVTAAASDPLVHRLDQLQAETGEGPCLDASSTGSSYYAADIADDRRWRTFGPLAAEVGVRSVLAHFLSPDRSSALNLYARRPGAFGPTDRTQGVLFATLAQLALGSASEREADDQRAVEFRDALRSRELIGQAQGILMEREHLTADQAFDVLRQSSQRLNVKLRAVAESFVRTGEAPPRPSRRSTSRTVEPSP